MNEEQIFKKFTGRLKRILTLAQDVAAGLHPQTTDTLQPPL